MDDIDLFSVNLFYYRGGAMPAMAPEKLFKAPPLAQAGAWIPAVFLKTVAHRRKPS
jgi:hypothetical protein